MPGSDYNYYFTPCATISCGYPTATASNVSVKKADRESGGRGEGGGREREAGGERESKYNLISNGVSEICFLGISKDFC